ncbi:1-deoxy-D-xylulose-5-phosphate synthase [Saccharopolyspora spinosa]|uniref:1-deoxy-D-xylulose-5-phosphate synthase n=1 Tax=Saccharopolyspora spinosa TaxID=60894 RepID=A0A2N3Y518_SACSN|nr:1-deoxy-D-xylulose-5-phosphate synthase [Saccharopolyspora spinosa]PKW18005.1 1-deoxy-D-xylulose-5-phosphate synthase [Saccharopolyspora spinosa]
MCILQTIHGPADLRVLSQADLVQLADEIRSVLIDTVRRTGGHLGPNLGVVELTLALHRVFDSPTDPIIWDTGHQTYVHKLLTGRHSEFDRLRQRGGISGYPSQSESEHDFVENSHASTALSYADGLAKAFDIRKESTRTAVAVLGDGALTGGMCWEALNNIGAEPNRPVVIVLNDNARSYAPTVGAVAEHLARLRMRRANDSRTTSDESLFERIGLHYLGPVDGHDIAAMERTLRQARDLRRPVVVHCVTRKGKGYAPAEENEADRLHAVGPNAPAFAPSGGGKKQTWTDAFGEEIARLADERADLVAVTAAMLRPVGLSRFSRNYPERVFDVGMAEQHAVTSAAGLAMGGLHPVVAIYSTFFNRAFDQALLDVALHRLPVTFVLDRAGVTGEDGPSHHGMWDLSILHNVPGIRVAAPRDADTLRAELREAVEYQGGPTVLRFPKATVGPDIPAVSTIGTLDMLVSGKQSDVLIVSVGAMAEDCVTAAAQLASHHIGVTVVDPRWVLPVNPLLAELAAAHRLVVTVEDNNRAGGFGTALAQLLHDRGVHTPVCALGIPPAFLAAGKRKELLAGAELSADLLARRIQREMAERLVPGGLLPRQQQLAGKRIAEVRA